MTADTSKSLDLHAHPEVGASPAASKDGKDADVVDSRTLAAIRCARRFIIGDPAYEIGQTDARLILDRLSRETARAEAAEAEAKALREAAEPFVRAADAAERNCFPLDGAVFRSALDYDMRALGRDNSEDVYRDSVRTSDLYRLRSIVTRATLAQPADGGK